MNIIYMHTHDTGRFIEPYGYKVSTPNLMKLASQGTLFRQAYCAGPTCSPSRSALLTGMAAHSCGMTGLAHRGFKLKDYKDHIANFLNENGYETALCGVQHEAPRDEMIGYQRILHSPDENKNSVEWDILNTKKVVDYLGEKKDKPFFLSFGMDNTHRVYPKDYKGIDPDYVIPPFPIHDNKDTREDMARFMTSVSLVDKCVGNVLKALEELNLENDTLVIYTTDHGIAFPKMKCTLYDTGIGVSLIMKYPGNKKAGRALDSLVSQIDIFPTICDLLGLEKPHRLQGKSIMPILNGEAHEVRDQIFAEINYHAAYEPTRCIRTQRYKYIKSFGDNLDFVPVNMDNSPSKDFFLNSGFLKGKKDREMLFDLYLDPVERVNLVDDPSYKDVYNSLVHKLDQWMEETEDPLLSGRVEKPEGAVINKATCISNEEQDFE